MRKSILEFQKQNPKIVAVTAYDATFASLVDAWVDIVLVGDSLGMVVQGKQTTLEVTMAEMIYHTQCVHRGLHTAHLVSDMPFLSFQISMEDTILNAGRLIQAGAQSVKVEGAGEALCETIRRMIEVGIPVMGHIGMTPQSVHRWGGFKVQGKEVSRRKELIDQAKALEAAGVYALVLESMPLDLAREITEQLSIPTIGVGAGPYCDGQVLVLYDILGMFQNFKPKFVKQYLNGSAVVQEVIQQYAREVKAGEFPLKEHSYGEVKT